MDNELRFGNDMPEFQFGSVYNKVSMNYVEATNKPSINGVELVGNLTSEDLKLSAGTGAIIIDDVKDTKEVVRQKLLSLLDEEGNLNKNAYLISDGMMLFILADVDTEDGKKQFRFKAGNLINMEGQNMSYSVEILYRISDTGELEKDYATGMFYDNEAIMQNVNNAIDEKITGALGGDY